MDAVVFVFKVDNKTIKLYDSDAVSVISNLAKVKSFEMPKKLRAQRILMP